jgi:hypothetical protein
MVGANQPVIKVMQMKIATILGLAGLTVSIARANLPPGIYTQPYYTLGNYTSSGIYKVYDDFTLASGATINQVDWSGVDGGGLTGFTVSFWDGAGPYPGGTLLASETIAGSAGETFSGDTDNIGRPIYNYSATLASPFSAAAGTEYMLSIVANTGSAGTWAWQRSMVGNLNAGAQESSGFDITGLNAAFTLESVPEPGTVTLGLLGALVCLFGRRRLLKSF